MQNPIANHHLKELLSILSDEELIRLRHRSQMRYLETLAEFLDIELAARAADSPPELISDDPD